MCGAQPVGRIDTDLQDPWQLQPAGRYQVLERRPLEEFHDDERAPVVLADIVDSADVGMVQSGRGQRLASKSTEGLGIFRQLVREQFERHKTMEPRVFRLVDDTHPAAPELMEDLVMRNRLFRHHGALEGWLMVLQEHHKPRTASCREHRRRSGPTAAPSLLEHWLPRHHRGLASNAREQGGAEMRTRGHFGSMPRRPTLFSERNCERDDSASRRNACGRYLLPAIGVVARPSVSSISVPHGSVMNAMRRPVALVLLRIAASVLIPAACSLATNASMFFTSKPM